MDKIIFFLNQIIEKNVWEDNLIKSKNDTGEGWNVYHLKLLKNLLEQYEKEKEHKN